MSRTLHFALAPLGVGGSGSVNRHTYERPLVTV